MGSGTSGLYAGTAGSSQPYAESYGVVPEMHKRDRDDENIWSGSEGYAKNGTATDLEKSIKDGKVYVAGNPIHGRIIYVINMQGEMIIGKRNNPNDPSARSPHPMLIGGKNPQVRMAGMIEFKNGKIFDFDNDSGHFRPPRQSEIEVRKVFDRLPNEVFHKTSKWRRG
uniref:Uncharacterized protein n=1 Tax=Muribaculaceae bacterium Z82 TaxID=2304548 RepID=A0A7C9JD95_9BACT